MSAAQRNECTVRLRIRQSMLLAKKNPCGKAWADNLFICDNEPTCIFPTGNASHLQQGRCVLFTKFSDNFWAKFRTPSHGFVMLRILKNCGFDGSRVCYESQTSMAVACCCSVRTLRNLLNELEEEGFINVNKHLKRTNQITLTTKTLSYMENIDVIGRICRQKR